MKSKDSNANTNSSVYSFCERTYFKQNCLSLSHFRAAAPVGHSRLGRTDRCPVSHRSCGRSQIPPRGDRRPLSEVPPAGRGGGARTGRDGRRRRGLTENADSEPPPAPTTPRAQPPQASPEQRRARHVLGRGKAGGREVPPPAPARAPPPPPPAAAPAPIPSRPVPPRPPQPRPPPKARKGRRMRLARRAGPAGAAEPTCCARAGGREEGESG